MAGTAFSTSNWDGFSEQSLTNPGAALTDPFFRVDISTLDATWKGNVQSDGADIRLTKGDDTEIPIDVMNWAYNAGSPTGIIVGKWSSTLAASGTQNVRVWAGYTPGTATVYLANETYGSDNVYRAACLLYLPMHEDPGGNMIDRTSNSNDGVVTDSDSDMTSVAGKLGNAVHFTGDSGDKIDCGGSLLSSAVCTAIFWFNLDDFVTNYGIVGIRKNAFSNGDEFGAVVRDSPEEDLVGPSWDNRINSAALIAGTWYHGAITLDSGGPTRELYLNGASQGSGTAINFSTFAATFQIGTRGFGTFPAKAKIQHVVLYSETWSDEEVAWDRLQIENQAIFWGTWAWTDGPGAPAPTLIQRTLTGVGI